MRSGRLRHRVSIEQPIDVVDEYGEQDGSWLRYSDRWAGIEPLAGRELVEAEQTEGRVTHRVVMRDSTDIQVGHRLLFKGRYLNIESIIHTDERGHEMTLMCREAV